MIQPPKDYRYFRKLFVVLLAFFGSYCTFAYGQEVGSPIARLDPIRTLNVLRVEVFSSDYPAGWSEGSASDRAELLRREVLGTADSVSDSDMQEVLSELLQQVFTKNGSDKYHWLCLDHDSAHSPVALHSLIERFPSSRYCDAIAKAAFEALKESDLYASANAWEWYFTAFREYPYAFSAGCVWAGLELKAITDSKLTSGASTDEERFHLKRRSNDIIELLERHEQFPHCVVVSPIATAYASEYLKEYYDSLFKESFGSVAPDMLTPDARTFLGDRRNELLADYPSANDTQHNLADRTRILNVLNSQKYLRVADGVAAFVAARKDAIEFQLAIQVLNERLNLLSVELDNRSQQILQAVAALSADVQGGFAGLEQRLDLISSTILEIRNDIEEVNDRLGSLDVQLDELIERSARMQNGLEGLMAGSRNLQKDLERLSKTNASIAATVQDLVETINGMVVQPESETSAPTPPDNLDTVYPVVLSQSVGEGQVRVTLDEAGGVTLYMEGENDSFNDTHKYSARAVILGVKEGVDGIVVLGVSPNHTLTIGSTWPKDHEKDKQWSDPVVAGEDIRGVRRVVIQAGFGKSSISLKEALIGVMEDIGDVVDAADALYKKVNDSSAGQAAQTAAAGS